jgi:hypothetical protein
LNLESLATRKLAMGSWRHKEHPTYVPDTVDPGEFDVQCI